MKQPPLEINNIKLDGEFFTVDNKHPAPEFQDSSFSFKSNGKQNQVQKNTWKQCSFKWIPKKMR